MTPVCPFVKAARPDDGSSRKPASEPACPVVNSNNKQQQQQQQKVEAKCPFGYDSQTFKLGPLSCMICQALLFQCSKCVPCSHSFCKACVSRFKDCPLCGADIEKIEDNENLQSLVDRFIEGHARIKRPHMDGGGENEEETEKVETQNDKRVIYEDVSLERGAFLVQQAMRAFRAQNIESAKSRLSVCAEDIRDQLGKMGNTSELCSQLGAVLGMLGDCCRATGDAGAAVAYFEESVEFLSKLPKDDLEITHTLSVSLNKIGDLKYYDGDLEAARSFYFRSLNVRRDAIKHDSNASQILDVAVSLAKVADVDRNIRNEDVAVGGFQEAIKLLESLTLKPEEAGLEPRLLSVREFLKSQITEKQADDLTV
ncbi:protein NCA1 [Ziziphus jujuba]|nr:protein NCA1 [Ziziphus jujuba]XP_015876148.1 protein NCA1 [Ziziphus jujuba]